ncbi:MAG: hypothetical protein HFJ41_04195 [Clostridia bacterium]|nr:hypothetical protein [Clostridia bacterium]
MKKASIAILLLIAMILTSFSTIVNAVEEDLTAVFNLSTANTNVKVGDTVEVTLSIGSLNGFTGLKEFLARKNYDSAIFKYIGVETKNGWRVDLDAAKISLSNTNGVSSGEMAVFKFEVLSEVNNTEIKLDQISASSDEVTVLEEDENVNAPVVQFKVTAKDPIKDPTDDPTDDPTKDPTDDPTDDPTKDPTDDPTKDPVKDPAGDSQKPSGSNTGGKNDKTTATTGKIPQTGEPYMLIVFGILGLVLTGISYARYQNQVRKMK